MERARKNEEEKEEGSGKGLASDGMRTGSGRRDVNRLNSSQHATGYYL